MNLPVDEIIALLEQARLETAQAKLTTAPPPSQLEIDVKSTKLTFEGFQAWCKQHQGQVVRVILDSTTNRSELVEVDKIIFTQNEDVQCCTLPLNPPWILVL